MKIYKVTTSMGQSAVFTTTDDEEYRVSIDGEHKFCGTQKQCEAYVWAHYGADIVKKEAGA
jgi:hypothetical protein